MDINSSTFLEQIAEEKVISKTTTTTMTTLTKDASKVAQELLEMTAEEINTGHLVQAQLTLKQSDVVINVETSIINLPLRYAKTIQKIVNDEQDYPINVYMIIEGPDVNRSKLRIDELASADDIAANSDKYVQTFADWITEHLAEMRENKANAEKAAKEAAKEAKKKPVKKTTKKRTTKKSASKKK